MGHIGNARTGSCPVTDDRRLWTTRMDMDRVGTQVGYGMGLFEYTGTDWRVYDVGIRIPQCWPAIPPDVCGWAPTPALSCGTWTTPGTRPGSG